MKKNRDGIILALGIFSMLITCRTFYSMGYFVDEYSLSPSDVLGGDAGVYLEWGGLLCITLIVISGFINSFTKIVQEEKGNIDSNYNKAIITKKATNVVILILSIISLGIICKTFISANIFLNERNLSAAEMLGGHLGVYLECGKIILIASIAVLSSMNIFQKNTYKLKKEEQL